MRVPRSLLAFGALLAGCRRGKDSVPGRFTSPSGRYAAVTSVDRSKADMTEYLCVAFEIRDATGTLRHREQTGASDVMRWEFEWDDRDRLWMYSGDIGIFRWERQADGTRERSTHEASDRTAPPRIRYHQDRVGLPR
jgi:hypothetical protein